MNKNKDLHEISQQYAEWRLQKSSKRAFIPNQLKHKAVRLAEVHGERLVAKAIGIQLKDVKRWAAKKLPITPEEDKHEFIDVTPTQGVKQALEASFTITTANGLRLAISHASNQELLTKLLHNLLKDASL